MKQGENLTNIYKMRYREKNINEIGNRCCGCRACGQACPTKAISFTQDAEGFMQPDVDETICIECGKCLKVCPIISVNVFEEQQIGYAAKTTSKEDINKCSSGGLFYVLARAVLDNEGVVCGCSTDENLMPKHTIAATITEAQGMRGSKYVQSDMNDVYTRIQEHLKAERTVLFTGVPCQVAGLRNYLMKDYPNLFCVDIICHGVPSRKLYAEYLEWLGKKYGGAITEFEFRTKKRHQWSLTQRAVVEKSNGSKKEHLLMASLDPYYHNFLQGTTYRESCYQCPYSQEKRSGDITIGDFWGIEQTHPNLFDIDGVSCALINSHKGKKLWMLTIGKVSSIEVPIEDIINYNGNLRKPTRRPQLRNSIYRYLNEGGFEKVPYDLRTWNFIIDNIKNYIPNVVRYRIKKFIKMIK